jgi:hypothetical protein
MTRRSAAFLVVVCCLAPAPALAPPGEPEDGSLERPALLQSPTLEPDSGRTTRASLGTEGLAYRIESKILRETRTINIALPRSFADTGPERRYPVTVVLDGEADLPEAAAVASKLSAAGQIPEMVLVAIENTDRLRDLTPPGLSVSGSSSREGGDRFLDFIEQELLPAVDSQLRGAAPRTLIGHSSGGILATYAAATRPAWRAVIALDTPVHLGQNWLAERLTAAAQQSRAGEAEGLPDVGRPPLRYVALEARFAWPDAAWNALVAAAPPSWRLHRETLARESHESMFLLGAYLGLREAFADYSMLAAPVAPTTSILPYYDQLATSLGAPVVPPRPLLSNVVDDLLMEGRGAAAHQAWDRLVAGYGAPADAAERLARIAEVEQRPPPAETVEGLLATPFPTPEEAAPWLGEWIGDVWMNDDELVAGRPREHLRLRVVDGRVEGEVENESAPGETRVRTITYLVVKPGGLTYGFLNGMRPRGLVLFEGEMREGKLEGTQRFGGIEVTYPQGMEPGVIRFRYERVR